MVEKPTFASVIKNRGFRFLWLNQILVQLGDNALNFALIIWVFKLTDSNLAVSGLLLSIYLPVILFGVFSGVLIDKVDKRRVIIVVDILLALVFFMFIFIKGSYPLILVNTFIRNCLVQFFMPAESSAIPKLVSKRQLMFANSLFSLTLYGAFMVGYTAGGPILNVFGINTLFLSGALLLAIASLLARNLPAIQTHPGKSPEFINLVSAARLTEMMGAALSEVKETFRFIKGKLSVMAAILLLSAVQGLIGVMAVIAPAYSERVLKIHATDTSFFMMFPVGLGIVLGAFVVGKWFHSIPRRFVVIPAVLLAGAIFVFIGLLPLLAQALHFSEIPQAPVHPRYFFRAPTLVTVFSILVFIVGFCMTFITVPSQTVLQESTPGKNRGKLFAVLAVIMTAFSAIPVVLVGGLSDLFGTAPIFVGLGVLVFIAGLLTWRPGWFFKEDHLPFRMREFLGLGHWEN